MSSIRSNREGPAGGRSHTALLCRRTGLALLLVVAGGCATFEPRPIDPAQTAAAFDARRLDSPALRRFIEAQIGRELAVWPPNAQQPWTLEWLTLAAYFHHPELDLARARVASAQAAEITAGARPNPTVSLSPTFNFDGASGLAPWKPVVDFDLPIETAGKRALRIARARQQTEAARHQFFTAAWSVRAGVRAALAEWHFAGSIAGHAELRSTLLKQQADLVSERLAAGEISAAEVTQARLAHEKTRIEHDLARDRHQAARAALATAIGVPVRALSELPIAIGPYSPQLSSAEISTLRGRALQGRADLRASLATYEASQVGLQLEIAKQRPDVHLGTGYEWDEGQSKWKLFSVGLDLPVFNRNEGPIAEARARRDEAAAAFDALQARASAEVDAAIAFFNSARARIFSEKAMFDAVSRNEAAARALVQSGDGTRLDLLRAQLERLDAQRLSAEVSHRHWLAVNALEEALQQPLDRRPGESAPPPPSTLAAPGTPNSRP